MASVTSCRSSPSPRIRLDLVTSPASRAARSTSSERVVPEAGPDPPEDARHGLDVVREHLRAGRRRPRASRSGSALKSGMSSSTPAAGDERRGSRGTVSRVQPGAAVGQVVARDAGDGRVPQAHRRDRLGDPARLVARRAAAACRCRSGRSRTAGCTGRRRSGRSPRGPPSTRRCWGSRPPRTPCAGPRSAPALFSSVYCRSGAQPGLDPRRLALDRDLAVAGLEAEHACGLRVRVPPLPGYVAAGARPSGARHDLAARRGRSRFSVPPPARRPPAQRVARLPPAAGIASTPTS